MCKLRWLAFVHNSLFLCTYIFYVVGLTRNRALKQSAELLVLYCSSDWFIMSQSRMDVDPFYCLVHVLKLRFFTLVLVSYVTPESLSWFIYDTNIHNAGARAVPNTLRRIVFRDRSSDGLLAIAGRARGRSRWGPPLGRRETTARRREGRTRGPGLVCASEGPGDEGDRRQASGSSTESGRGRRRRGRGEGARPEGARRPGTELLCSC